MFDWSVHESLLRLTPFAGMFLLMVVWETLAPRRVLNQSRATRWVNNLSIVFLNSLLLRLVFPAAAVGVALYVEAQGWGLLNGMAIHQAVPLWLLALVGVILLDFAIWAQHRVFHLVPVLWRLHRMHHADVDIDVTTGLRFHPLEILLSMLIKALVIVVLGVPPGAVLIFEILLNATAMFNHGNVRIPKKIDQMIRLLFVTPDMHRVHHSWYPDETNSNYGFSLSVWDRWFGTYRAQPKDGHLAMTIGLKEFRQPVDTRLDRMLMQPFITIDRPSRTANQKAH